MYLVCFIFFLFYVLLIGGLLLVGYFLQVKKESNYWVDETEPKSKICANGKSICLDNLVVILPFRNEEQRIHGLLNSILNTTKLPKEFIFVDDHSSDKTADLIADKLKNIPFRILKLPDGVEGKKRAIRMAMEQSESEFILSLDADVEFQKYYFSNLAQLRPCDMYILPVVFNARNWLESLFELDPLLVNAANLGISGWKRPILASGANLLFSRIAFQELDDFERHAHIASGDDMYALRDFREGGAEIRLISDFALAVSTETPQSLKEFFHQRLRWIAKTGDVKDALGSMLAILQVLVTFTFLGLLLFSAFQLEWKSFWYIFILKTSIDLGQFFPYFFRIKRLRTWLFIPFYEVLFPIYSLSILIAILCVKPIWKGRILVNN
jgi:cellulose synthase/poly-beta-1,6-N-acetylglucosamine synthase-like glycosyltransferase